MESSEQELLKRRSKHQKRMPSTYSLQSSFTLNDTKMEDEYDQDNVGKILNRLGLEDHKDRNV